MIETTLSLEADAQHAEARRNALILAVAQAMSGSAPPIAITLGGLPAFICSAPTSRLRRFR